jgi:hypothetical protein
MAHVFCNSAAPRERGSIRRKATLGLVEAAVYTYLLTDVHDYTQ